MNEMDEHLIVEDSEYITMCIEAANDKKQKESTAQSVILTKSIPFYGFGTLRT